MTLRAFHSNAAIRPKFCSSLLAVPSDNGHVTDVNFSGGTGIVPAIQQCVSPTAVSTLSASCQEFTGGEFGLLIDATEAGFAGKSVSGTTLTTPEPDVGILVLSAAFAFGLLKLLRRGALL